MTEFVIRVQLVDEKGKVWRSFDAKIPDYVPGLNPEDSHHSRAEMFYNRIQKVMQGKATKND